MTLDIKHKTTWNGYLLLKSTRRRAKQMTKYINEWLTFSKLSATEIHTIGSVQMSGAIITKKWMAELGRIKEE